MDLFSKQKLTAWAITLLVILNIVILYTLWTSTAAPNQAPMHERGQQPDPLVNKLLLKELNLSDQQYEQIVTLRKEHHRKAKQISRESHDLKKELMDQLFEENDPIAIELLTNEIGENQALFEREVFQHFKQIQTILNADQNKKLKNLLLRVTSKAGTPPKHPPLGGPPPRP